VLQSSRVLTVLLVGPGFHENLALEYLAAAANTTQHQAHILAYGSRQDTASVVEQVLRLNADVVGLSIAFQFSLTDSVCLAEQLRLCGFTGHMTCGGHVATFEYQALLRDCAALDSVVRHDGERTLLELLDKLSRGEPLRGVQGLVWRDGSEVVVEPRRRALSNLDDLPFPLRAAETRRLAGVPTSFVIGSRGCVGDCAYCCIRAFAHDAEGAAYRLRRPDAIAQEIAQLTNQKGACGIFLEDDLFVLPAEPRAVERIRVLERSLTELSVPKCAYWAKARPDTLTKAVLEAAKDLGIIHFFIGIENHSPARLSYLGRSHQPEQNERALTLLRESGIGASFNIMLFDPDCCLDDIAKNIDFLAQHLDLPWNICRTELYSGTELVERVAAEGRLLGDYRNYGYVMRDPRAELMFRVLRVCFRQWAFDATSLLNHVITLCFGYQLHQALHPGIGSDELASEIQALSASVHADTVELLRRVFEFASHADIEDAAKARRFAVEVGFEINNRDLAWRKECEHYLHLLNTRGQSVNCQKGLEPAGSERG
jgi:anaerobic magnesium-protoporphyrin IX monomethyl ester cyclase